jgi:hypothetical protein
MAKENHSIILFLQVFFSADFWVSLLFLELSLKWQLFYYYYYYYVFLQNFIPLANF